MSEPLIAATEDAVGFLTREFAVRVLNCSPAGCLLETAVPLEAGTAGSLRLALGDQHLLDHVVVVRCQRIEGAGSVYHIGARFLLLDALADRSTRRVFGQKSVQGSLVVRS